MLLPTSIMAVLALTLVTIGFFNGTDQHVHGIKAAAGLFVTIFPLLVFALIVAGMTQVLLPQEMINSWIGNNSGLKGILAGTIAGLLAPGGPYVSMPIAAGLITAGAAIGPMVAFITSWALWSISRMPLEIGILGWKFTAIRIISSFFLAPLAGVVAHLLFRGTKIV